MTSRQWSQRLAASQADGATQYSQSWAMVHFLAMDKGPDGEYLYRPRLLKMLRLLHEGKGGDDAFELAFGNNVRGFEKRFVEYALACEPRPKPRSSSTRTCWPTCSSISAATAGGSTTSNPSADTSSPAASTSTTSTAAWSGTRRRNMNTYFADLKGRLFPPDELYFSLRTAPLPDLLCRCGSELVLPPASTMPPTGWSITS